MFYSRVADEEEFDDIQDSFFMQRHVAAASNLIQSVNHMNNNNTSNNTSITLSLHPGTNTISNRLAAIANTEISNSNSNTTIEGNNINNNNENLNNNIAITGTPLLLTPGNSPTREEVYNIRRNINTLNTASTNTNDDKNIKSDHTSFNKSNSLDNIIAAANNNNSNNSSLDNQIYDEVTGLHAWNIDFVSPTVLIG